MFNKALKYGDILMLNEQQEEERQGIRFEKYGGSRWPENKVPYAISRAFSSSQKRAITQAVEVWNNEVKCVRFVPRRWWQRDYVFFFDGNGCYSNLGRVGGQQPISIDTNGCLSQSTILHEMDHAVGFAHEQNRSDRDKYIRVLFENIPEEWRSQYEKTNSEDFGLQGNYDYYSVMHYPVGAPGTDKPAFEVLDKNIDLSKIGHGEGFTEMDIQKIHELYCS
ncbi:zinc metalloproteinase nas-13-like [Stegodyphus dumicola]|uniref:zinc metalloproteinase nas-13-like n=1 Tax=Stegodyphus dumicola TaxID=202533 RepID=UPI0015A8D0C1|nr:zinc metalloproteinase nas-13-like [Stegodyphus dumicola]